MNGSIKRKRPTRGVWLRGTTLDYREAKPRNAVRRILPSARAQRNPELSNKPAVRATKVCRPKRVQSLTNRYPRFRCPYSFLVEVLFGSGALSRLLVPRLALAKPVTCKSQQTLGGDLSTATFAAMRRRTGKGLELA